MQKVAQVFVAGVPYPQAKVRGDTEGPLRWSKAVKDATAGLDSVSGPCSLSVEFVLPVDKFPEDYPLGPDLDNYVKRLQDALGETVLCQAPGKDSCVVELRATKRKALPKEATGAWVTIERL